MKKIRLITAIIFTLTLCTLLAMGVGAKWWDENPFTDVKSNSWYYDAVRICNENELVAGMSETKFAPNVKMTRAMIVTMLAKDAGFEGGYTSTPFSDVKAGHWFAPYVQWAYDNDVTSGVSDTAFAPNREITREQLAAMLYRYAAFKGISTDNSADISGFVDVSKVSSWAKESIEWANGNSIISGSKKGEELYLNPKNSATRAECAQMLSKFLYLDPVYEINGNDLSLYKIVYSESEIDSVKEGAELLSQYIEKSVGISLPVVSDKEAVSDHEILVGKTNRQVAFDLSTLTEDTQFVCTVEGDRLIIMGKDDITDLNGNGDRTHHNMDGSFNAVHYFLEEEFNYEFYYDGEGIIAIPDPIISLEDGYRYIDAVAFESIGMYINDAGSECYLHNSYYEEWGCGFPHQLGNLMMHGEASSDNMWGNPCYSDPENIDKLLTNVKALLEKKPELNLVGLIQNDNSEICDCENCKAIYREHGRAGTLMLLVNRVAETYAEEYPDVRFATWAYGWSATPPSSDLCYHENVILYYNTIALCPCHEYTDTTCSKNKNSAKTIKRWGEKASKLYLWEHTGCFGDAIIPAQDLDSLLANAKYFYENGVRGAFLNGRTGNTSDLYALRAYLFTQLYRNPTMTEEEYSYHINGFLKAYFGDSWSYIRNYTDAIAEIANEFCTGTHAGALGTYDFELVAKEGDKINAMWDKAEAAATDPVKLDRIKMHRISWTYLWQCARYKRDYTNGDDASREAYKAVSQELYNEILHYEVKWDGFNEEPSGDLEKMPCQW